MRDKDDEVQGAYFWAELTVSAASFGAACEQIKPSFDSLNGSLLQLKALGSDLWTLATEGDQSSHSPALIPQCSDASLLKLSDGAHLYFDSGSDAYVSQGAHESIIESMAELEEHAFLHGAGKNQPVGLLSQPEEIEPLKPVVTAVKRSVCFDDIV